MGLAIREFSFAYDKGSSFSLQVNCFDLDPHELVFLHGASGCGKTTLLDLLSGVCPSSVVENTRTVFPTISYVMHESTLLPWATVGANVAIEQRLRRRKADWPMFAGLCQEMGLPGDVSRARPPHLSLGMRQRVEIAKALAFRPDMLLLDESLSGLDSAAKRVVARVLWRAVSAGNTAVVATAHQIPDLLMLAQRVCFIRGGRVAHSITIQESVQERLHMSAQQLMRLQAAEPLLAD